MQDILNILDLLPRVAARCLFYYRSQKWDRQRLQSYRDEMLRRLIRHAGQNVPYYRRLFRENGIDTEKFRGQIDMPKIPVLDKETLRTRVNEFMAENISHFKAKWSKTSGSTGTPLKFMLSTESRANDIAATIRSYDWAGYQPGKKVFSVRSFLSGNWEFKYNFLGTSLNYDATRLSRKSAIRVWKEINRLKPSVWIGFPFQMIMLGYYALDEKIRIHRPKSIITVGDSLVLPYKLKLEKIYGSKIYDFYGMTENCAMITDCEYGKKHIIEDFAFHEVLGTDGNEVNNENGELISTSYYNYAMPLIRYKTRDLIKLLPSNMVCDCGRNFRMVEDIEGRKEDFIKTPEGRLVNLFDEPTGMGKGITLSQYVQDSPDHMYVNIIPGSDFEKEFLINVEKFLRERLGNSIKIEFKIVSELETRGGGKTPFVISKIGNSLYDV
jgi:phenylacetate-CoA ligase